MIEYGRDRYSCSAKLLPQHIVSKNSGIAGAKAEEVKSVRPGSRYPLGMKLRSSKQNGPCFLLTCHDALGLASVMRWLSRKPDFEPCS